ncbi:MAG: GGDEF domain-containing protein [Myxococcales bacterium]|nr:GGDEF domain-containing protein [Myxococcales bacterium]
MSDDWKTRVTEIRPPAPPEGAPTGQACLVLIYPAGADLGKRFELQLPEVVIGRGADTDIQVDRDSVSRRHARLDRRGNRWGLCDLGSTNGTYVNDLPVVGDRLLEDGDLVKIGAAIFKFLTGGNVEAAYHEEIYQMTIIDGLTRAHNKRYFTEMLERELARIARNHRPLSLVMFDIDHFKVINDTHGHLTGDHVLKELAGRVRTRIRREEIFARYGGEEFVVLLPEATDENALEFAEQIRLLIEKQPFEFEGDSISVTISCGVATVNDEVLGEAFIKLADDNLYKAKRGGRNRVVGPEVE